MSECDAEQHWNGIDLSGDPFLLLGRRIKDDFDIVRIELHEDLFKEMYSVSCAAKNRLLSTNSKPFEVHASIEPSDEHFVLTLEDIQKARDEAIQDNRIHVDDTSSVSVSRAAEPGGDPLYKESSPSALLQKLKNPGGVRVIDEEEMKNFPSLFYAVAWQQSSGWAFFIRKENPKSILKAGRRWCRYGGTLKKVSEEPTFVFDQSIDAVFYKDRIAGFSSYVIKNLFTDIGLSRAHVPDYVQQASSLIESEIPLSGRSIDSLHAIGKKKYSVVSRLYGLASRIKELQDYGVLTAENFRIAAQWDSDYDLVNDNNEFDFGEEGAESFLDIIEGRYFEDDWTGYLRRADKYSTRKQKTN